MKKYYTADKRKYGINVRGYNHQEFIDSVRKLMKFYHSLTQEEEETIKKIAKRFL